MKFALLVLYAAGTLAVPVLGGRIPPKEVKAITCSGTRFRRGTTLEYAYAGETINTVEGTTTDRTGLQLTSRVLITQLEKCELRMQILDAELRSKSKSEDAFTKTAETESFKQGLEKNDLIFRMEDGKITSLHPHLSETTEILNIKRGILSTLQLDEKAETETDVNGVCKTTVTKIDNTFVKTKILSTCSNRVQDEIGIQSASIKTQSDLKPLDSKSKCTFTKDDNMIRMVTCEETHLFRPFSAGFKTPSGAMTTVKQVLKFIKYNKARNVNINMDEYKEKTLTFEHSEVVTQTDSLNDQVEEVMKRLIDQSHLSVKQTSAHEFTSLVILFRKMNNKNMKAVWEKYFDCVTSGVCGKTDMNLKDLYRQYMLDAIAYCGTPSCVSVVKDVAISGEVSGERANMFLQSIALVGKTTNGMIRDVLDIAQQKPSRQVFLTLGTLISRHCSKSPADCVVQARSPVIQAENFLEKTLGLDCSGQENHVRVEEILMTIKAIGNAKRPINARSALIRCAKNAIHDNITMSAFDALRGMPCDERITGELRQVVEDENIDADKRIYAFTASMKCPTRTNLEKLVHQYNLEKSNQLTSFMWSYFTNILESSDPANKIARENLLSITKETPLKITDLAMYQYSKNFEKSIYLESLKSGASAKANLVFNPDGFLPKTAVFDLTAKVMGVPVDLVETAVGIDGVETLVENIFGPDGDLPSNFVLNVFNWTVTAEKLKEMAQRRTNREKRSIKPDDNLTINKIHSKVDKKPAQPSGFLSLKVMGQEVRIMSYDDIYAMIDQIDNMNVIQMLMKLAKGGEKTFSKSMMFLEMTHTVPTGVGLPLKLKLVGSTVSTVELNGKFDIRNMFWGPGAVSINGYVKPSAVVDVSGQMGIESSFASSGLLVSSNMVVSNMMKGGIEYKEGQLLKINLDTPTKPVQLFKFSSTPYMFVNEKNEMIEGVPRIINTNKCLKSQLIGYGLCTSIRAPVAFRNYESPYFPLSGPAHFGMTLVRGDERLTTYQFLMSMTKKTNGYDGIIELSTPGAIYERKVNGKMSYTNVNDIKTVSVSTERFGRTGSVEVSYNAITNRASVEAKNNFFTKKDMVARFVYFNETSVDGKQYGIRTSVEYDWYKFEHVAKYVKTPTSHSLNSKTTYYPGKAVTAALEYDTVEKKVTARFDADPIKQAEVKLTGQWENTVGEKGVTITATHVYSGKKAVIYGGYKGASNMKVLMTSVTVDGKAVRSHLKYYVTGAVQTMESVILFDNSSANFVATLENHAVEKTMKFSADVMGRKASSVVLFTNQDTKKTFDVTVNVLNKKANANIEITHSNAEKSIKIASTAVGKNAQAKMGYYNNGGTTIFRIDCDVLGKHAELFWNIQKAEGYRSTMGAVFGKYNLGLQGVYTTNHGREKRVCSSMYYGVIGAERYPVKACASLDDLSTANVTNKQVTFSLDMPLLGKKSEMIFNVQKKTGHLTLVNEVVYNSQVLCKKTLDAEYNDPSNSYVAFDMKAGRVTTGLKVYSKKQADGTDFGFEATAMGKSVSFLNQYKLTTTEEGTRNMVTSSLTINGKTLPVTTAMSYLPGNGFSKMTARVNLGKYSLVKSLNLLYKSQYGVQCACMIMKENAELFKVFNDFVVTYTQVKKGVEQSFGVAINGKTYKYGWAIGYNDQSTESKRVHALNFQLQYAAERKSTATFTFVNSAKTTEVLVDVEYIPKKTVSHSISYYKAERLLDVSVEFLPKMFAKFMGRLEGESYYTLNTQMSLEWKNVKSVVRVINTYENNDRMFKVSTNFGNDVGIAFTFNKTPTKSVSLSAQAFGKSAEFIATYQNLDLTLQLLANRKRIFKFEVSYDRIAKSVRVIIKKGEKTIVDLTTTYNKYLARFTATYNKYLVRFTAAYNKYLVRFTADYNKLFAAFEKLLKKYKINIADVKQWAADVKKWASGINKLVGVNIENPKESTTIITFNIMGRKYVKVIFNKKTKSISVQYKNDLSLLFSYLPKTKSFTFSAKTTTKRVGLIIRADWENKIAAIHGIVNKNTFGMKTFMENRALNFKVIVTPELIMKTNVAYTDNTLTTTFQRISGDNVINEATFNYKLSKKFCQLVLKWNTEYIQKITKKLSTAIRPMWKSTITKIRAVVIKVWKEFMENYGKMMERSRELSIEMVTKTREAIMSFLNTMDKAFDNFDFVAARDKVGETALIALRRLSSMNIKALKKIAVMLDNLKTQVPTSVEKLKEISIKLQLQLQKAIKILTADSKIMVARAEEMMAQAKELIRKGRKMATAEAKVLTQKGEELLKKGKEMLKTVDIDVEKKLRVVREVVMKIVRNLTESTAPVLKKAIELIKDFKIKGKRLEDIVIMLKTDGMKYMKIYIKDLTVKFDELKAKAIIKFNELKAEATIKFKELKAKATIKYEELKVKLIELNKKASVLLEKATVYVMKMEIPYINKTVGEVIKIIKMKVEELKTKIEELKVKISSLDVKKLFEEMKTKIMKFEIKGKTVEQYIAFIKQKIAELEVKITQSIPIIKKKMTQSITIIKNKIAVLAEEMKKLPEISRQALHQLVSYIKDIETYIQHIDQYVNRIVEFVKPLTKHSVLVGKSIKKHFGPLWEKVISNIKKRIPFPQIKPFIDAELKIIVKFATPLLKPILPLINNIIDQIRKMDVMGVKLGPLFDMQVREIKRIVKDSKARVAEQIKTIKSWVTKLQAFTPDQLIDKSMDQTIATCKDIVKYLKSVYKNREALVKTAIKAAEAIIKKLKDQARDAKGKFTKKTAEKIADTVIKFTTRSIVNSAGVLSHAAKQMSAMDVSTPAWKAWTEADVLGQLEKYGISGKISSAIKIAKDVNITEVVRKTFAAMRNSVLETEKTVIAEINKIYDVVKTVIKYIKSIPKKDYDTWFAELKQFALTSEKVLIQTLTKVYETSRKRAIKSYEAMRKLGIESEKIYQDSVIVAKKWYQLLAQASGLVYDDVKQPTIIVYTHYKNITSDFVMKQYKIVKAKIENWEEELKLKINELIENISSKMYEVRKIAVEMKVKLEKKIDEIRVRVEKIYADFLAKYGDMTWEEIYESLEKLVKEKYAQVDKMVIAQYKEISKVIMEKIEVIKVKVLEIKGKLVAEYNKFIKTTYPQLKKRVIERYEEYKAKVIEIYKEYNTKVIETYKEYKAKVIETYKKYNTKVMEIVKQYKAKAIYIYEQYKALVTAEVEKMTVIMKKVAIDVKTKVTDIYNKNKNKTLKQIYTEIKKFIKAMYVKQKRLIIEFADKKIATAKAFATETIQKYRTKMREVWLPEIEAMINQTLRAHVILTKEVITAYTPQAILIKNLINKYLGIVKVKMPVIIAELKKYADIVKVNIPVITAKINKYIEIVKAEIPTIISKVEKYIDIAKSKIPFITDELKKMEAQINDKINVVLTEAVRMFNNIKQSLERTSLRDVKEQVKKIYNFVYGVVKQTISIVKSEIEKQMEIIRKDGWEHYVKYTLKNIKNTLEGFLGFTIKDIMENVDYYVKKMETNPTVLKIKAKLIELKTLAVQEIEKLKINPAVIKMKEDLIELKKRLVQKVEELLRSPTAIKIKGKLIELKNLIVQKFEESKVKMAELETLILQKMEELKINPTVLKMKAKLIEFKKLVLEKVKESKEKLIQMEKQILQTIEELKTNPTVLKLKTKLIELKKQLLEKFEESKVKMAEMKKEIARKFEEFRLKSWTKLIELEKQISQKIEELKKSEIVHKINSTLVELNKKILQKFDELRKNPTILRIKAELKTKIDEIKMKLEVTIKQIIKMIEEKIRETKIKIAEIKVIAGQKGKELMKTLATYKSLLTKYYKTVMPDIIDVMKQMKTSGKFTADKLVEELKPYLTQASETIIKDIVEMPIAVKEAVNYYMDAPEDAFWNGVAVTKEAITDAYELTKALNMKIIIAECKSYYNEVEAFSRDLVTKCTDTWTKNTTRKIYNNVKELLRKIYGNAEVLLKKIEIRLKSLVATVEELVVKAKAFYKENLAIVEARLKKEWLALKKVATEKWVELEALAKKEWAALEKKVTEKLIALKTKVTEKWVAMVAKITKEWETFNTMMTKGLSALKTSWNKSIIKAMIENPIWSEISDEIKRHELVVLAKQIADKAWDVYGKQIAVLVKKLNELKAKIEARYAEVKTEVMAKYAELKTKGEATYAELKKEVTTKLAALKVKLAALKVKIAKWMKNLPALKEAIKAKYIELKGKAIKGFNEIIKQLEKFYEETTIADMVAFVKKMYELAVKKVQEARLKFDELKVKYTKEIKMLYAKCEQEMKDLYKKVKAKVEKDLKELQAKVEEVVKELKAKVEKLVKELQAKVMSCYEKLRAKVMVIYKNYRPIVEAEYKKVVAEFNTLKEKLMKLKSKVIAQYDELKEKVVAKFEELKTKAEAKYKELKAKFEELKEKFDEFKGKVIVKLEAIKVKLVAKYKEIVAELRKIIGKWTTSKLRADIIAFKQMLVTKFNELKKTNVRQTIEFLKNVTTVEYVEERINLVYGKVKVIATEIIKEIIGQMDKKYQEVKGILSKECQEIIGKMEKKYQEIIGKMDKKYQEIIGIMGKKYQDLIKILKIQQQELMKKLEPFIASTKTAFKWINNEIEETAEFIYKYYGLLEKYNKVVEYIKKEIKKIRDYVTKETERIAARAPVILKKYSDECKAALKKTAGEYAEKCKTLVQVYAKDAQKFVKDLPKFAKIAGDKTLRGIHSGMVYIDNIDVGKIKAEVSKLVGKIRDYVSVNINNGEIVLRIYHRDITPSFKFQLNRVKVVVKTVEIATMKTVNDLTNKGKEILKKIDIELANLKEKAEKLRKEIQKKVMETTVELRKDMRLIYKTNRNISIRLAIDAKKVADYAEAMMQVAKQILTKKVKGTMKLVETMSKQYYAKFIQISKAFLDNAETILMDIYKSTTMREAFQKFRLYADKYYKLVSTQSKMFYGKYKPLIQQILLNTIDTLKRRGTELEEELKPYYASLKTAYEQLKGGVSVQEALKPILDQLKAFKMPFKVDIEAKICKKDPLLCKYVNESIHLGKMLTKKYAAKVREYFTTAKAQLDRTARIMNKMRKIGYGSEGYERYLATAMIMGNHILTFDNKFYEFVGFKSSECSYLLARDFQDKKFTIVKTSGGIVIETPDMAIKIRDDGRTKTTIQNKVSFSLPVESGNSKCVRVDNLILCHFKDQKMKITVDLKHQYTTISISGWYQGKSQGLLGTYNHETHDDWRLPNSKITKNINEFANAYELTGSAKCKLRLNEDHVKACNKPASRGCQRVFANSKSPLAKYFDKVNPSPFMEACRCVKRSARMHCDLAASYIAMLRSQGVWASQLPECMSDKGHQINEEWVQKTAKKNLDIVVMISQRQTMMKSRKRISVMMYHLHKMLKQNKIAPRFALIGFGGQGVHEQAHIHPLRRGQTVFGYIKDLNMEIKNMPFKGQNSATNDAYHAILIASKLKFRAGAEKAFVVFNTEPHDSHENGPSFNEALYILRKEANAPLFVFDDINFRNFGKTVGHVIGETTRKLYTSKNLQGVANNDLVLPASEFRTMALQSEGGLFSNMLKKPKQIAISLHDAIFTWVTADSKLCKRCTLKGSWTGLPRPVCVSDKKARC